MRETIEAVRDDRRLKALKSLRKRIDERIEDRLQEIKLDVRRKHNTVFPGDES
jgi:hypothetical protein